jgi:hypothetical protein
VRHRDIGTKGTKVKTARATGEREDTKRQNSKGKDEDNNDNEREETKDEK